MEIYARYIAKDGKLFDDPLKCEEYEKSLGILSGSVGHLINILQKETTDKQYITGIVIVRQSDNRKILARYTGDISHHLEDYVNVDNLKTEQRYEASTVGGLLRTLKELDKDLPCQYMIAYSDNLNMTCCGMLSNYNPKVWNDENK